MSTVQCQAKVMKTTLDPDDDLLRNAKTRAATDGITLRSWKMRCLGASFLRRGAVSGCLSTFRW